jgi:GNAT superfamily N-acetyltransferase
MVPGEEHLVSQLALDIFDRAVAPEFSKNGVREFRRYAAPKALARRAEGDHFVLVAEEQGTLVGMIEVRRYHHVAMLFTTRSGRGIGRQLLRQALTVCRAHSPDLERITVHSAPSAVPAYERLGFTPEGAERVENGIRYVPMASTVHQHHC